MKTLIVVVTVAVLAVAWELGFMFGGYLLKVSPPPPVKGRDYIINTHIIPR